MLTRGDKNDKKYFLNINPLKSSLIIFDCYNFNKSKKPKMFESKNACIFPHIPLFDDARYHIMRHTKLELAYKCSHFYHLPKQTSNDYNKNIIFIYN